MLLKSDQVPVMMVLGGGCEDVKVRKAQFASPIYVYFSENDNLKLDRQTDQIPVMKYDGRNINKTDEEKYFFKNN